MEVTTTYARLVESLASAPIIDKGGYDYFVHPLSDGIPPVEPDLLHEATAGLVNHLGPLLEDIDLFVTAEAMGLPLATAVSLATGKPFVTVRKRSYGLPDEVAVRQETGYSSSDLYLNGIPEGARVAILDDVISTGGTLRALAEGIERANARLVAVAAVFTKDPDLRQVAARLGAPVFALLSCRVESDPQGKRVVVVDTDCRSDRAL